jgi:PAS domain S-box-containing protein
MNEDAPSTVLLVEDNRGDARLLREMLNEQGAHSTELTHVECMNEAETHLAQGAFDIILLDLGLPDAQGLEAVRRAHAAAPRIPLVVLTGLDDESLGAQALQEGAQDYLVKGQITTRGLVRTLRYSIERKILEEARSQSEEQLKRAQRNAHMGTDFRDLRTGEREWSDETYRIFGVNRETFDATYENVFALIHPDDRDLVLAARARTAASVCPDPLEYRIIRPDGSIRHVYREWELIRDDAGKPLQLLGTIHDITERRRTEEQLRQAQKMEAIGNLTGGMAHDFNNLLGIIIGNLDLLRDRQHGDPDADELSREALDAALRGADLTQRLLAFARRQPLKPARTDVNELIVRIVKLLERTLGEEVQITLDLNPQTWPVVVDPAQLESSLTNLATNARDAMLGGGRLKIGTRNRSLDADYAAQHAEVQPGDYAMIEVSDSGTGMPREVATHVFEPFYTTKEQGKGTGLGLSMVFGFIKQSGGHISVYSEVGIGTTFRLYLPRVAAGAATTAAAPSEPFVRGRGETVLAVEDNAALRRVVVRQLSELGYRVLEADNVQTALDVMERERVDLLFTDIVMPGGTSGYELACATQSRWTNVKVVLTSGFPESRFTDDERLHNMRLLSKPYRRDDLGRTIREVLAGSPAR